MEELSDKEFIQRCAEWPGARLPVEASIRLSLISIGQGIYIGADTNIKELLHVLYGTAGLHRKCVACEMSSVVLSGSVTSLRRNEIVS